MTKSPNQAVYDYATPVTLNATAGPSYHFVGWSGDTTGTTNPLTVPVIRNKSITATFAINTYTLATSVLAGQGIIDRNPDLTDYPEGSTVDLTAIAATGYHFTSWGGDASGTDALAPVLMDRNKSANASFAINRHTVTVTVNGSGTVTRSPDQPLYDYGSQVTLTAVPAAGFHFAGWTGGLTGSTNPVNLLVNGDKTVQARFIPNAYTLNVSVTGGAGTIGRSPDLATYSPGQHVVITLTPGPGFQFADFTIPNLGVATFNPIEFDMDSNTTVIGRVVAEAATRPERDDPGLGNGDQGSRFDQLLAGHARADDRVVRTRLPLHRLDRPGGAVDQSAGRVHGSRQALQRDLRDRPRRAHRERQRQRIGGQGPRPAGLPARLDGSADRQSGSRILVRDLGRRHLGIG